MLFTYKGLQSQTDHIDFAKNFSLITINSTTWEETHKTLEFIKSKGGVVSIISTKNHLIGWVTERTANSIIGKEGILSIDHEYVSENDAKAKSNMPITVLKYFNSVVDGKILKSTQKQVAKSIDSDKMLRSIGEVVSNSQTKGIQGTNSIIDDPFKFNSEYMIGRIAISVFFVESDGSIDENLHSWSYSSIEKIRKEILAACAIWTWTAHSRFGKDVSFITKTFGFNSQVTKQPYEPILNHINRDRLWINEIMDNLEIQPNTSHLERVTEYNNHLKEELLADHSFSAFVAKNKEERNYPDVFIGSATVADAHRGGPYLKILEHTGPGLDFFQAFGHETAHIFHAYDEYDESSCTYTFNGVKNLNNICHPIHQDCLMDKNSYTGNGIDALRVWEICEYTAAQLGWKTLTPKATLESPKNNEIIEGTSVLIEWNRNTSNFLIDSYLKIWNDFTGEVVFFENQGPDVTSKLISGLTIGNYKWQIINGKDDDNHGFALVESDSWEFEISLPSYPVLEFNGFQVNDGTDRGGKGDGDSKAESGEKIDLDVKIYNSGDANAQNVSAMLSTSDPDITILNDNLSWGRINPSTGNWASNFEFEISFECPTKEIAFVLEITSNEGKWSETFKVPVYNNPSVYIPDVNFEQVLIDEEIDSDGILNQKILLSDALAVTDELRLDDKGIMNLTGLEAFENLERLYVEGNKLDKIDVSKNRKLKILRCGRNKIKNLDVSSNLKLTDLRFSVNQIEYIDLTKNAALEWLSCTSNLLSSIDITENTNLEYLSCGTNPLNSLDLSNNLALTRLRANNLGLNTIDLTNNLKLVSLECHSNQLSSLDLTQNIHLTEIDGGSNKLVNLDLSKNAVLQELDVASNLLEQLDLSKNINLIDIDCRKNNLSFLDLRNGVDPSKIDLEAKENNLICITVDDESLDFDWGVDDEVSFSTDCEYLIVSPHNLIVDHNADDRVISVSSNRDWSIKVENDWLSFDEVTNGGFVLKLTQNLTYVERIGSLTLAGTDISKIVSITQDASPCNPPAEFSIADISQTSVSLSWNSSNESVEYTIEYRIKGDINWTESINKLASVGHKMDGLICNSEYEYRIKTICGSEYVSGWSETQSFKTNFCDSDNDGIANNLDLCPNTQDGEIPNDAGCSERQLNNAPTNIKISSKTIHENEPSNTQVGDLTTDDLDSNDSHVYTLITATDSFEIVNNVLVSKVLFDYEFQDYYRVIIESSDLYESIEKEFIISISNVNDTPSDLTLDNLTLAENNALDDQIGLLSTTDQDSDDSHTYSLVDDFGDNSSFKIADNALQAAESYNFEVKNSYDVKVNTCDAGGLCFEKAFTISVTDINEVPTGITLGNLTIPENNAIDDLVGLMEAIDEDAGDTHTFSFVDGDNDNASFSITDNMLEANEVFDFETKSSFDILIQTEDAEGEPYQEGFTINIENEVESSINIPSQLTFEPTALRWSSEMTVSIENDGETDLTVAMTNSNEAPFTLHTNSLDLAIGESKDLVITFNPELAQDYEAVITFNFAGLEKKMTLVGTGAIITGIDDTNIVADEVGVYPNPATDQITVNLKAYGANKPELKFISPTGVELLYLRHIVKDEVSIDISNYPSGIYLVHLRVGNGVVVKRVILKKQQ